MALQTPDIPVKKLPHHEQLELCVTRARYRQGRKLTAVRVYTVNDESKYLIVNGVPAIKICQEIEMLCQRYGDLEYIHLLPEYPHEDYVEVYLIKYRWLKNARFAKRQLDGKSFYGQVLHVCYAPELETVEETREKLQERRKSVAALTRHQQDPVAVSHVRKRRLMPPTAMRYMNQLRPDLRQENMDRLHPRVEDSHLTNSGECSEGKGDSGAASGDKSHTSQVCSENLSDETATATSVSNANLNNGSEKRTSEPCNVSQDVCGNIDRRDKRSIETCMTTKKKIKLFGNKNLLSYKQE
ncbi:RNA-binding protein 48-like [Scylla paramamosain]|uniref:RNA-binding protein 48-like n=1 Tax=Scylla paramamosain TaxID=85552 RepID=UPI0030834E84